MGWRASCGLVVQAWCQYCGQAETERGGGCVEGIAGGLRSAPGGELNFWRHKPWIVKLLARYPAEKFVQTLIKIIGDFAVLAWLVKAT